MESINNRLLTLWERLKASNLVVTKTATPENINEFNKILNMSVPVTQYEHGVQDMLRHLYTDRKTYFQFIHNGNCAHYILLTSAAPIIGELKLSGVVDITWNSYDKEFIVVAVPTESTSIFCSNKINTESNKMNIDRNDRDDRTELPYRDTHLRHDAGRKIDGRIPRNKDKYNKNKDKYNKNTGNNAGNKPRFGRGNDITSGATIPQISNIQYTEILTRAQEQQLISYADVVTSNSKPPAPIQNCDSTGGPVISAAEPAEIKPVSWADDV